MGNNLLYYKKINFGHNYLIIPYRYAVHIPSPATDTSYISIHASDRPGKGQQSFGIHADLDFYTSYIPKTISYIQRQYATLVRARNI